MGKGKGKTSVRSLPSELQMKVYLVPKLQRLEREESSRDSEKMAGATASAAQKDGTELLSLSSLQQALQ